MITHNLIQGSDEWHQHRIAHFNASDAPAMLGVSPYETRTQLLERIKTGITPEIDSNTQARFNSGHRAEALARRHAEQILDEDLSPVVGTLDRCSASFDGITFMGDVLFEHKLLSSRLEELVWLADAEDFLQEDYLVQMEQQLMVSGAERCLFMASKWGANDDLIEERHCWYMPNFERRQRIIDGWAQFEKDLADFVPRAINERPAAEQVEAFPVPSIQVRGELVACNLADITPVFDRFLAETNTDLKTDQQFAQGEADAKASREAAKTCKLKAKEVVDQIAPVSEVVRKLEAYAGKFDALGLKLEKAVKEQKDIIKTNIALEATGKWHDHIAALEKETHPIRMVIPKPDFGAAMKSMRTIASLHNAADTALANAKAEAESIARDIRAKLAWCKEHADGYGFLFSDLQQIIYQPTEAFQIVVHGRVEQHKKAEAERLEQERQRIQAEEQAKAAAGEKANIPDDDGTKQEHTRGVDAPHKLATGVGGAAPMNPGRTNTGARIKLGDINAALGFMVTMDFLASIGWAPVSKERNALMYREVDFPAICESIINHVANVANHDFRKAA